MTRAVSLLVVSLIMAAPLPARAAGLITALTASANPVNVNTDVTFTVKGTGGGCGDLSIDYGDGQTIQLTSVSFSNNTNTTSPAHKYAVAKTYLVNATPGKSCAGTATLNMVVTSASGGGGGGGGVFNRGARFSEVARDRAPLYMALLTPRIDTVFPFSIIQPGGGVIVQGANFGTQPGQFKLKLQNGFETSLVNLTWEAKVVSGIIEANVAGVIDQPATLQVIGSNGQPSNSVPVQFTARRQVMFLPMEDVHFDCSSGSDNNKCNDFQYPPSPHSFAGFHQCTGIYFSCNDSGTDTYWATLANGWQYSSAQNWGGKSRSDQPVIVTDEPGFFKFTLYWDTTGNSSVNYRGPIYVEGPAGTSWR